MKIALCGIHEEVNTFATDSTGPSTITGNMSTGFQRFEGQATIDAYKGTQSWPGGWVDAFIEESEVEFVPVAFYNFTAGPTIQRDAYQKMKQDILDTLKAAMPLDAVAIQAHGAGVAEGVDDVEGDLCAAVRQLVGPEVKLACALDHHCNLTDFHKDQMDFITIVKEYPHLDMHDSSYRAARMLIDMVNGKTKPIGHFEHLPLMHSCFSTMPGNVHAPIRDKVVEFAKRDGIYELSYGYGFPFADVPFNSSVVNCWANTAELAASTARELAAWVWQNREQFRCRAVSAADAVKQAIAELEKQGRVKPEECTPLMIDELNVQLQDAGSEAARSFGFLPDAKAKGPIVIAEKSDNPGGGAPGDATHVLWELLKNNVQEAAVCTIKDPQTVTQAMKAGIGKTIDVRLGGKASPSGGDPVAAKAYVKSISDGHYTIRSEMGRGYAFDTGPSVGLLVEGVDVTVISGTNQAFDAQQMKLNGFDPLDYRVIVLKSANHFRAWWTDVASLIIDCDPPGIASNDLFTFTFKKKNQKLYPLDDDATYPAASAK